MNGSLLAYVLFAQISRWQRMGDGIHRNHERLDFAELLPVGIVLALFAAVIAVVVFLKKRNDFSQHCNDSQRLFRELSLAHNIDRASQKILRQLADASQASQPAEVFLRPALFESSNLPQELREDEEQIQSLKEQLF